MGTIESGVCHVGDKCIIMPNRTCVKISNIYYDDKEIKSSGYGEKVRLKLEDVEEKVTFLLLLIIIF